MARTRRQTTDLSFKFQCSNHYTMPAQETVCIHTIELLIYRKKNPLLLWGDMKKKRKIC